MTNKKEIDVLDSNSDLNLSLDTIANLCYPRVITCETDDDTLSIDGGVFAAFWWAANYIIDKVLMPITDNVLYYIREDLGHYETSSYQSPKGASKGTYYNNCGNFINETKQHYDSSFDKHEEVVLGNTTTFFGLVWW
ncbi:hypothetical protein RHORCCE3_0152 [Rickettsia hoogstraalii str. RCCE3]|nr:hypothetical protein RHORCCE3_0152 [Rickettsia hoogstraalii str. RCCE3]